jgi:hypothetical protein
MCDDIFDVLRLNRAVDVDDDDLQPLRDPLIRKRF